MNCLENQSICTVKKENNQGYYRIHTIWMNDKVRINIASKDSSWTGEMTSEIIKKISTELNIEPEKYLADCREALTTDDGKDNYSYAVENGCFVWKKTVDEDSGIKIRMGSVLVQPISFTETIQNMMDLSLNCKKNLQKQVLDLTNQNDKDKQRIVKLENKLAELCGIKNSMENDLYRKFLLLLNSKKRRIRELEESLHIKSESVKENTESIKLTSKSNSTSSDLYEMDTDDDDEEQIVEEPQINLDLSSQSQNTTSKKTCDHFSKHYEDIVGHKTYSNVSTTELDNSKNFVNQNLLRGNSTNDFINNCHDSPFVKNSNKCFPNTKKDVLNFFFGADD